MDIQGKLVDSSFTFRFSNTWGPFPQKRAHAGTPARFHPVSRGCLVLGVCKTYGRASCSEMIAHSSHSTYCSLPNRFVQALKPSNLKLLDEEPEKGRFGMQAQKADDLPADSGTFSQDQRLKHGCCWEAFYILAYCCLVGNPHLTA